MSKNKVLSVFCILFTVLMLIVVVFRVGMEMGTTLAAGAASSEPGSAGDPLVTQSYLEKRIKEVSGKSNSTSAASDSDASYKKVTVNSGKIITGDTSTEFIIYSGSGSITGASGIINLTTGEKFSSGNTAVKYCIYLVSDSDCGIRMTSKSVVFVRGNYKIR